MNHDLLAEVDENVPTTIARTLWQAGRLPTHIVAPAVLAGTPFANLEIFTQAPSVELAPDPDGAGIIGVFRQPMIIRNDTIAGEIANTLVARLPLHLVERIVDGVEVQLLELDLSDVTVANTSLSNTENAIVQAIIDRLTSGTDPIRIPVTPPTLPGVRFFPVLGDDRVCLKVYGNIDGRDAGPTSAQPVLLTQQPLFDPPPFADVAAAIDGELFLAQVNDRFVEEGLVDGKVIVDQLNHVLLNLSVSGEITIDPDVDLPWFPDGQFTLPLEIDLSPTLQRIRLTDDLTVELLGGVIRVAGSIFATIDNGPDVDADFDLRIAFNFVDGQLVPRIMRADIDVDTTLYQVVVGVLFGPVAGLLAILLDDAIDDAASKAVTGQTFPVDTPTETVFVQDVAITNDPENQSPVRLNLEPFRMLVRPDAVAVTLRLHPHAPTVPIPVPTYFIGNTKSKEVHDPACQFVELMNPSRQSRFVRVTEAVAAGYDGCRLCLPAFDGLGAAFLFLQFIRPAGFNQKRTTPIRITGQRVSTTPTNLQTTFSVVGKLTNSNADGYYVDGIDAGLLAQGRWSLTLVDGDWTATKTVELRGGEHKHNMVRFEYGVDSPPVGAPIGGIRLTYVTTTAQAAELILHPLYLGTYLGTPDGTAATAKWQTSIGGNEMSGHAVLHRDVPFLRPGPWRVTVLEHGKQQVRTVDVTANQIKNVVFHRP